MFSMLRKSMLVACTTLAYADTMSLVLENDALVGQDQHYTNGIYYTWMSENTTAFPDVLSFIDLPQKNVAFSFSHAIFTPEDKKRDSRNLDDLPYAGYMGMNLLAYKSSEHFFHEAGLNVGMVGPSTQAEELQKGFHSLIGHSKPKGWEYQLNDEMMYGISYQVGYKTAPMSLNDLSLDFTTHIRGDAGRFYTGGLLGGTLRLSSAPMKSFATIGNYIGGNESILLNYEAKKHFEWALSLGAFYNAVDRYYLIDEAIDQGYRLKKMDSLMGEKLSLDLFYDEMQLSFYLKSVDIDYKGGRSSNEKTGGMQLVWKW
ncbi:MAG: lipid A deacylase LpxR family protein [Epsilonproteobacteria bacterium]|nr:lipid A deacylase LpxR family protein [Campylobacterota bacterium]